MFNKFLRVVIIFAASLAMMLFVSVTVFAKSVDCAGDISGTAVSENTNSGTVYFGPEGGGDVPISLKILGKNEMGLAPANEMYEACVSTGDNETDDLYELRGWVWNDNLGFISLYCDGGGTNEGINCGPNNYGVTVGAFDGNKRMLSGYAWNDVFGWISFRNPVGEAIIYGVEADSDGNLSGYGWTAAGVWMNFDGGKLELPSAAPAANENCNGVLCVEITPDPTEGDFSAAVGASDAVKIADGVDGYYVHLYFQDSSIPDLNNFWNIYDQDVFSQTFKLNWKDTVKVNQLAGSSIGDSLKDVRTPFYDTSTNRSGAVTFKPLIWSDFQQYSENGVSVPGHYVSRQKISSYAPTTDANVSVTTSTDPVWYFENETFLVDLGLPGSERSELILNEAVFELRKKADGALVPPTVAYPNQKYALHFRFRPAVELNVLYANDNQDKIQAYRGIPLNFVLDARKIGTFPSAALDTTNIDLILDYDQQASSNWCEENYGSTEDEEKNFDFYFIEEDCGENDVDCRSVFTKQYRYGGGGALEDLVPGTIVNLQAVANLPENDVEGLEAACEVAAAPAIFSEVSYTYDNVSVSYYSNKLPRVAGSMIMNPAAVIKGNIYAPQAFRPNAGQQATAGDLNANETRDASFENVKKFLKDVNNLRSSGATECVIKGLGANGGAAIFGCSENVNYKKINIGTKENAQGQTVPKEVALYFYNSSVLLKTGYGNPLGDNYVLIVEGGNLFMDDDVWKEDSADAGLSVVVFRGFGQNYGQAGNVYLKPTVKNMRANLMLDGSLFSYSGNHSGRSVMSGEPIWNSFAEMQNALKMQFRLEGSLSSRNTIGGSEVKGNYLLLGTGEVVEGPNYDLAERMRAQIYDLNYLRMVIPELEMYEGLPVDQKCRKALSYDDIALIESGGTLIGPNGKVCDGIDPFKLFDAGATNSETGDLVPPKDTSILARGSDPNSDFDPVYIEYVPSDSFVFTSEGETSID